MQATHDNLRFTKSCPYSMTLCSDSVFDFCCFMVPKSAHIRRSDGMPSSFESMRSMKSDC